MFRLRAIVTFTLVCLAVCGGEDLFDRYCKVEDPLARYPIPKPDEKLIGTQKSFFSTPYDLSPGTFQINLVKGLDAVDNSSFTGTVQGMVGSFTYKFTAKDPSLLKKDEHKYPNRKVISTNLIQFRQLGEVKEKNILVNMDVHRVLPEGRGFEGSIGFADGELPFRVDVLKADLNRRLPQVRCRQYGKHAKQSFDVYYPKGFRPGVDEPLPMRVFIHGGGWGAGDKINTKIGAPGGEADKFNEAGIALVAVGYRYVGEYEEHPAMTVPVAAPLLDAARCLQYIRHHAAELGLDPTRVCPTGGSAGGATTCWLAMHDDLAAPNSPDPVARESTRVTCAIPLQAQTSIDPVRMREWIPTITYGAHAFHKKLPKDTKERFQYGLDHRDEVLQAIEDFSAYRHASKDDPPMLHVYGGRPNIMPPVNDGNATHHPQFGVKLHERLKELGVESWIWAGDGKYKDGHITAERYDGWGGMLDFTLHHFGMTGKED